jgi:hypothetical protein
VERTPASRTAKAPASNFTGDVYVNSIFRGDQPSRMTVALVRFTPGARTNWHSHPSSRDKWLDQLQAGGYATHTIERRAGAAKA